MQQSSLSCSVLGRSPQAHWMTNSAVGLQNMNFSSQLNIGIERHCRPTSATACSTVIRHTNHKRERWSGCLEADVLLSCILTPFFLFSPWKSGPITCIGKCSSSPGSTTMSESPLGEWPPFGAEPASCPPTCRACGIYWR